MTKSYEEQLKELAHELGEAIVEQIEGMVVKDYQEHEFPTTYQYEGDGGEAMKYIDDDDEVEVREDVERNIDAHECVEMIRTNEYLRNCLSEIVNYVVWNKEMEA